ECRLLVNRSFAKPMTLLQAWCKMRENQKLHVSSVGDRAEVVGAGVRLEQVTELRVLRGRSLCGEEASSPVQVNRLVDEYVRALCKLDEIRVAIGVPGDNHSTGRRVEAKCEDRKDRRMIDENRGNRNAGLRIQLGKRRARVRAARHATWPHRDQRNSH